MSPHRNPPIRNDGVKYAIYWVKFKPGTSIFLPCLTCTQLRSKIKERFRRFNYGYVIKICIEEGIRGLRVWRTF